jgi:excisionase family DNA binding protein
MRKPRNDIAHQDSGKLPLGEAREAEQSPSGNGRQVGEFLSLAEAGHLLGVGRCRAWELARAGLLPAIRLGRRWYVPRRALDALVSHALEQTREALARQEERR